MTYLKLFTVLAILPLCFACKSSPPETGKPYLRKLRIKKGFNLILFSGGHHQTGGDSDLDWQGSNTGGSSQTGGNTGGSSQTGGNIGGSSQTGSNNGFQVEGPITYDLDVPDGTFIRNLLL